MWVETERRGKTPESKPNRPALTGSHALRGQIALYRGRNSGGQRQLARNARWSRRYLPVSAVLLRPALRTSAATSDNFVAVPCHSLPLRLSPSFLYLDRQSVGDTRTRVRTWRADETFQNKFHGAWRPPATTSSERTADTHRTHRNTLWLLSLRFIVNRLISFLRAIVKRELRPTRRFTLLLPPFLAVVCAASQRRFNWRDTDIENSLVLLSS